MGLRIRVSDVQTAFYIFLVALGILGNAAIIGVIGESILKDQGGSRSSDIILVNMALSNLVVSITRNALLVISDLGVELYSSKEWCQFLMGLWVWLRSVNVWSIFFLSAFHFQTLRRVSPLSVSRGPSKVLFFIFGLIWFLNLVYSLPAFVFSTSGDRNSTETLMLVSSTTRPLLGCVWNFPGSYSGLAYATTSMVIHEGLPILLMSITNMGSLLTLYAHRRSLLHSQNNPEVPVIRRVPAERRAAKVILALIMLFISSWGTSIISVNYFNYNRGTSTEFLLVIARFANITFIALSPIVLAVGHRRLRAVLKALLTH
ncbi:olfactory receptor class A-like protein 4 [Engraulis encrasicolus]|uniref:olfactory receptor class A-like protein 4 n=1 Tax=Engraulis encrasicolus TaxID=184585 RepID=UPI002FD017A2